jgi:4-aminobutyrate--pyruvate transaminase
MPTLAREQTMPSPAKNRKRGLARLIHPYSHLANLEEAGPLIIERGQGCYVYDAEGKAYLEAMSGLWCASLGFSDSRLIQAALEQLKKLPYYQCFGPRGHAPALELAEKLTSLAPAGLSRALFANSGSEANDSAVKVAWYYNNALGRPRKKKIVARSGSYHGVTVISGSLTGQERVHLDFDLPVPGIVHADFPSFYHRARPGETQAQFGARLVRNLEELIIKEDPETVAAFIAEPVIAGSGVIPPPPGYFEGVQSVLKKYDILFIVDEVVTGFGRTGEMFASRLYGLEPDLMTVAKGLSSAYLPISALLMTEPIVDVLKSQSRKLGGFFHGTTYSAHPVAAAVALEVIRIYEQDGLIERVKQLEPYFLKRLSELSSSPLVGETRGVGLLGGVELTLDKEFKRPFPKSAAAPAKVQNEAARRGLMIRAAGNAVALAPPLIIAAEQIDELFDILARTLEAAQVFLAQDGPVVSRADE